MNRMTCLKTICSLRMVVNWQSPWLVVNRGTCSGVLQSYMDHTSLVKNYICRRVKVATRSTVIIDLPSLTGSLQTNTLPHRKLIQLFTSSQYPDHYQRGSIGVAHSPKIWAYISPSRNGIKPDPAICELLKWAVSIYQKGQTLFP